MTPSFLILLTATATRFGTFVANFTPMLTSIGLIALNGLSITPNAGSLTHIGSSRSITLTTCCPADSSSSTFATTLHPCFSSTLRTSHQNCLTGCWGVSFGFWAWDYPLRKLWPEATISSTWTWCFLTGLACWSLLIWKSYRLMFEKLS